MSRIPMMLTAIARTSVLTDLTAPTIPALTAIRTTHTSANLSWTASTDSVGVTGYGLERCSGESCMDFAPIATSTATTYSDTGLTAGTTYRYRVRASDAAGNISDYSPVASAVAFETTPPTAPASLNATAVSETQIDLSWAASTDNVGVEHYRVERFAPAHRARTFRRSLHERRPRSRTLAARQASRIATRFARAMPLEICPATRPSPVQLRSILLRRPCRERLALQISPQRPQRPTGPPRLTMSVLLTTTID